ncbi:hypothetical protein EON66_02135 [archaeon]|nr:MAG: hypothetical protein EON66_02135 [archaeon]
MLARRYKVQGYLGRGVFSSVLFCHDVLAVDTRTADVNDDDTIEAAAEGNVTTAAAPMAVGASGALVKQHAALATGSCTQVAIKVMRANDTMRRAGLKELESLRALATADPDGRYHCVRLLHHFEHLNHLCLVFEPLNMNLKDVQNKFGSGVGLAISAVRAYAKQMLLALSLTAKLRLIHADIKPHNILANDKFNIIKVRFSRVCWHVWERATGSGQGDASSPMRQCAHNSSTVCAPPATPSPERAFLHACHVCSLLTLAARSGRTVLTTCPPRCWRLAFTVRPKSFWDSSPPSPWTCGAWVGAQWRAQAAVAPRRRVLRDYPTHVLLHIHCARMHAAPFTNACSVLHLRAVHRPAAIRGCG